MLIAFEKSYCLIRESGIKGISFDNMTGRILRYCIVNNDTKKTETTY